MWPKRSLVLCQNMKLSGNLSQMHICFCMAFPETISKKLRWVLPPYHNGEFEGKSLVSVPAFLPGESHGRRSLAGYSPQGHSQTQLKWLSIYTLTHMILTKPKGRRSISISQIRKVTIYMVVWHSKSHNLRRNLVHSQSGAPVLH